MIRGALTNGHEWIFFLLKLNDDGNGGKYFQSKGIPLMTASRGEEMVSRETSSLIAAIIAHWVGPMITLNMPLRAADYFVSWAPDPA